MNESMDMETLDQELDALRLDATDLLKETTWQTRLEVLSGKIDHACDIGALAHYQWKYLVTKIDQIKGLASQV